MAANVFVKHNIKVQLFSDVVPTPVVVSFFNLIQDSPSLIFKIFYAKHFLPSITFFKKVIFFISATAKKLKYRFLILKLIKKIF